MLHVSYQYTRARNYEEPKTKAGRRRVPLFDDVAEFFKLRRFAATCQSDDCPVFPGAEDRPLQHRGVQRGFDAARENARKKLKGGFRHDDGDPVTFHDLRHAFASRCASRGVHVGTLSAIMGHADVGITTSIYTHLYGREEAERAFREAMSSRAVIGNSLAGSDHAQPGLAGSAQRATKPN